MLELHDIANICKQFTQETGIDITEKARTQIVDLINCVEVDSHETWLSDEDLPEDYFRSWQERLPGVLMQIAKEHQLEKFMTAIDVVYWTGHHLQDPRVLAICFPGPDGIPGEVASQWFPWRLEDLSRLTMNEQGRLVLSDSVE